MKRDTLFSALCIVTTLFVVTSTSLRAQSPTSSDQDQVKNNIAQLQAKALSDQTAWQVVEDLTSEVGARLAGSPSDARAVAFMQDRFKALKFDRVWLEPVRFPIWERRTESARIVSPYPQSLSVTALGASIGTGKKPLRGQIVMFDSVESLKAASDQSAKNKIVFIKKRMQQSHDGAGYGQAVGARSQGAHEAARLGAKAILIRSIGTSDDRFAHTGTGVNRGEILDDAKRLEKYKLTHSGIPIIATEVPAAALSNPDADQLERLLARGNPIEIELQLDVGFKGEYTSHNVIGQINGREKPDEIVLIGGHLDSWDLGTGAIDDGAGVAITTAAAYLISQLPERPRRSIRVVAFANEESGLYGGKAYVDAHQDELSNHQIAAESDFGADVIYALGTRVAVDALGVVDEIMQALAPLNIRRASNNSGAGPDLRYLFLAGVPTAELLQNGEDYFDYHHTANDTLDKIDPKKLQQNVAAYATFAYFAAETETRFSQGLLPKVVQ